MVEWVTGVMVLGVDLERLTGWTPKKIFRAMDGRTQGCVSEDDWNKFFEAAMAGDISELIERAGQQGYKGLRKRSEDKLKKLRAQASSGTLRRPTLKALVNEDRMDDGRRGRRGPRLVRLDDENAR